MTAREPDQIYDCIVIGCGPAGTSAAIYLARAKLKTLMLDKSPSSGALASSSGIENYPGVPGPLPGAKLIERMRQQATSFGAECCRAQVLGVDLSSEPKQVFTPEATYRTRSVIISAGAMDRRVKIPGEQELLGKGVSYCATCDAAFFEGQDCALAGDGEEALEETLLLTRYASKVYFICPKREIGGPEDLVEMVKAHPKVETIVRASVVEIIGTEAVNAVRIALSDESERTLTVRGVFLLTGGGAATTGFLGDALPLGENGCLLVGPDQATAIPGVFAAGDVTCNQVKQAVVAAAEGVIAALSADKYLNRRERVRMDYK